MKKLFIILLIIFITGCDDNPTGTKEEENDVVYTEVAVDEDNGILKISNVVWAYKSMNPFRYIITGLVENVGISILYNVKIYTNAYNLSDELIESKYYLYPSPINPGQRLSWKIEYLYCEQMIHKLTVGYSYEVTVNVPALKVVNK